MGQAVRKFKPPPSRPGAASRATVPRFKIEAEEVQRHPEARVVDEPEHSNEQAWSRPDPDMVSMSRRVVGSITTRKGGKQEHPSAKISEEYTRPMPTDRHTTILSGPDEERIQAPGTLNHAHIRELFLLHQDKLGDRTGSTVEDLAARFNADPELLRQVLRHTRLVHTSDPASHGVTPVGNTAQQTTAVIPQHTKVTETFEVKKQPV